MKPHHGTFTDPRDGREYRTVTIGSQTWLAENLQATHFLNGDPIPHVPEPEKWGDAEQGGWCSFQNSGENEREYGRLYNWFTVNDPRGLAPEGWHIPTDREWQQLELFLGMTGEEAGHTGWRGKDCGNMLKEKGPGHWRESNEHASNSSGFSALPGGYRDVSGDFYVLGYSGYWWSSTLHHPYFAWYRSLYYTGSEIHRTYGYAGDGYSVRCIKDS